MDKEDYKVDKLSLIEQQEVRANERVAEIEERCNQAPVAFLKSNYGFEKIRNRATEPEIRPLIGAAMLKAAVLAGVKNLDPANKYDITNSILSAYNDLTIEEIYKAFELERYGVYEDRTEHFQLFNAEYVTTVLKKYRNWKQNTKIQHNISPPVQLPEITESEKKEILNKGILRVFEEYKETKVMPEPNNYIFDALYEQGIIPDGTTPEIQAYYQKKHVQATEEVEKELKAASNTFDPVEKRQIKDELEKIINNNSDKVSARVKKIILCDYFSKLIREGKSITDILNKP